MVRLELGSEDKGRVCNGSGEVDVSPGARAGFRVVCSGSLPQDVVRFHTAVLVAGAHDRDTKRIDRHRYLKPGGSFTMFERVKSTRARLDGSALIR